MSDVRGSIGIKDNVTGVLQSIKKEQSAFRRDVDATRKSLEKTWNKKRQARIDTAPATKKVKKLIKAAAPLKKKLVTVTAVKDIATAKLKKVKNQVKAVGKMAAKPVISIKNKTAAGFSKIKGGLAGLAKAVAIPVTIAAVAGTAMLSSTVAGGMKLEQQQISMEHFIGATNKEMSASDVKSTAAAFTDALRENSNATPFETGEVIAAGSRAIAIASGDTKEAMGFVKLAEDMAAASGGTKSISDAIEALADAKLGEMERLKEFGFKVSKEEFDSKGFEGVAGDLNDFYGGAAQKLAGSGAGLLSTIKGKLKSNFDDFGLKVVEKLKPVFSDTIGLIDEAAPFISEFGSNMAEGIGSGIKTVIGYLPKLKGFINSVKPIFTSLYTAVVPVISGIMEDISVAIPAIMPVITSVMSSVISTVAAVAPIIGGLVSIISSAIVTLAPVFQTIWDGISDKIATAVGIVSEHMGFFGSVFDAVFPAIGEVMTAAWDIISPILDIALTTFELLLSVAEAVFPGVQAVITTVWDIIKPVVESIGGALEEVAGAWDWLVGQVTGETQKSKSSAGKSMPPVGHNALGTDNWRGGVTWVGEKGPELVEVPKGARILPSKSSAKLANSFNTSRPLTPLSNQNTERVKESAQSIVLNIAKIADSVIIREDADIEKIGEAIARRLKNAKVNFA